MSIELQLAPAPFALHLPFIGIPEAYFEESRWVTREILRSRWNLEPVEWCALNIALENYHPARFPVEHPPYSVAGEQAFLKLLDLRASYSDRFEKRSGIMFENLLLSSDDVYLPIPARFRSGPDEVVLSVGSVSGLLRELDSLQQIMMEGALIEHDAALGSVAVVSRVCRTAVALKNALRLKFVPDLRPPDAPVRYFTASVEGFSDVRSVVANFVRKVVEVALGSGYVYQIPFEFIQEIEGFTDHDFAGAEQMDRLPVVLLHFQGAESLEWSWDTLLTFCEPAYVEFGDVTEPRRGIIKKWLSQIKTFRARMTATAPV